MYEIQDKNERQATGSWYLENDEKHGKLVEIVAASTLDDNINIGCFPIVQDDVHSSQNSTGYVMSGSSSNAYSAWSSYVSLVFRLRFSATPLTSLKSSLCQLALRETYRLHVLRIGMRLITLASASREKGTLRGASLRRKRAKCLKEALEQRQRNSRVVGCFDACCN